MPSFKAIGPVVLEKKIFKGFEHFLAWRPSWSCDLHHLYKLLFPHPKEAPHEIWLWLVKWFQRRSLKMWTDDDGRRTTYDGRRTPDHGYTISSPCEPKGSGELKRVALYFYRITKFYMQDILTKWAKLRYLWSHEMLKKDVFNFRQTSLPSFSI